MSTPMSAELYASVYDRVINDVRTQDATAIQKTGEILSILCKEGTNISRNFHAQLLEDVRGIYRERFCKRSAAPVQAPEPVGRKASEPFVPTVNKPVLDLSSFIGTFTVVDGDEYETIRIKAGTGNFDGKFIASYLSGSDNESDYTGFAFIGTDGSVNVWRKFKTPEGKISPAMAPKVLAVSVVLFGGADNARELYAMRSGKCSRCGRKLTVPASLHRGMGPDCAGM